MDRAALSYARDCLDLMEDLLLDAHDAIGLFHLRVGNIDAESLEFGRRNEARIHFASKP